jgi:hypothetical protein
VTYADAGKWDSLSIETREVKGFDDKMASMLFVVAAKKQLKNGLQVHDIAWILPLFVA